MKFPRVQRFGRGAAAAFAVFACAGLSFADLLESGFKKIAAGDFDFTDPNNWHAEIIDGVFAHTPLGVQHIVFGEWAETPSEGLKFNLGAGETSPTLVLRGAGGAQVLTLFGDVQVLGSNAASITFGSADANQALDLELADDRIFKVEATNTLTILNSIFDNYDGYALKKKGDGRLVLVGAANFSGGTQVLEGTLAVAGENALPTDGTVAVSAGAALAIEANQTLAGIGGEGVVEIFDGRLLELYTTDDLCFDGTITGAGALRFYGDSGGTLTLKGDNTYGGGTWIDAGTVYALNASGSATGTGPVAVAQWAKLQIGDGYGSGAVSGDIQVAAGGEVVFAVGSANPATYAGAITDEGRVTVDLWTELTLTGANTYSGATRVKPGSMLVAGAANALSPNSVVYLYGGYYPATLKVEADATTAGLASGSEGGYYEGVVEIADGATLTLDVGAGDPLQFDGEILTENDGRLIKTGEGTQVLAGPNWISGGTQVAEGTLRIQEDGSDALVGDVEIAAGATLEFSPSEGASYEGVLSGDGRLLKTSKSEYGSELYLRGANGDFEGSLEVADGRVYLDTLFTIGTAADVSIADGAAVLLRADQTFATLTGSTGAEVIFAEDEFPAFLPTLRVLTIAGDENSNFGGSISGYGKLVKSGGGTLTLTEASEYTGGTFVSGGKLVVTNFEGSATGTGAITVDAGAELQIGNGSSGPGAVSGMITNHGAVIFNQPSGIYENGIAGTGDVRVASGSTLMFNAAQSYVGGTTVGESAWLILNYSGGNTLATSGDVTLLGGVVLDVNFNQTIRALSSTSATSAINIASGQALTVNLPEMSASFAGTIRGGAGSTLVKDGPGTWEFLGAANPDYLDPSSDGFGLSPLGLVVNAGTVRIGNGGTTGAFLGDITVNTAGTVSVSRSDDVVFPFDVNGTGVFVKEGAGNITLTGVNGFTGTLMIDDGAITVNADNAAAEELKVQVNAGGTFAVGSGVSTGITVASLTGAGATTIAAGKELTVVVENDEIHEGTFSGEGALRKTGAGIYELVGSSSYSGDTWIQSGTLLGGASGALSGESVFRVKGGAMLQVDADNRIGGLNDYTTGESGTVKVATGAVLTVDNGIANTFSGALEGAGGFTKRGTGTLTFAGSSTLSGAARIEQGTLVVGAPVAFTAGSLWVETGATFDVANSTSVASLSGDGATIVRSGATLTLSAPGTLSSTISGAGGVTFQNANQSSGVTMVMRKQTFSGPTTVTAGTLRFSGSSEVTGENIHGSDISLGAGTKVEFGWGDSLYGYSGSISGGGSLVKMGAGTLVLSGSNSYSGATTVNGGTLKIGATNTLPTTTTVMVANGATLQVAADQTIGGFFSGDGLWGSILLEAGQVLNAMLGSSSVGTDFGGVISGEGGLRIGPSSEGRVVMLTADNTYTGGTTIDSGGALLLGDGFSPGGTIVGNVVNHGALIFQPGNDVKFTGVISGTGGVNLGLGAGGPDLGVVSLTAANSYTGGTRVYGGILFANNPSGSATGSGLVQVLDGGVLAGTGTIAGPVEIDVGGVIAPAGGLGVPGTLTVGATTFGGGGEFVFQIADAEGEAGTDYSLLAISGQLAIAATGADRFTVQMYSVGPDGRVANFDPSQAYSWMFVTADKVTGFDVAKFEFNLENFSVALTGAFSVSQVENNLLINYSPASIPEPSTWMLLGGGLVVVVLVARSRRARA